MRARAAIAALVALPLSVGLLAVDARHRREARALRRSAIDTLAERLPSSDLALSGGARWLRSPSMEEPCAAFADGPALPDPDPAGGAMSPPIAAWGRAR